MTLRRQLLLVSLLALLLPWAGCQFVRETESALRASQQQMLAGTARAIADSLSQYPDAFPAAEAATSVSRQLYAHALETSPVVDGYFEDWPISESSLVPLPADAPYAHYVLGSHAGQLYLFVAVSDPTVVYATSASLAPSARAPWADRVVLASVTPPDDEAHIAFAAEAPGAVVPFVENAFGFALEPTIRAVWQDVPGGYQLEARLPRAQIGTHAGLLVEDVSDAARPGRRAASWEGTRLPVFVGPADALSDVARGLVQPGLRLIVTDAAGWRIASVGSLQSAATATPTGVSRWLRSAYDAVVEDGTPPAYAEPDPGGRERQDYVGAALAGEAGADWFRSREGSEAIVAVAQPIASGGRTLGTVILQQGTDAILSLTNRGLVRLLNTTLIAMLLVGGGLLGYATWLSRRIRRLSVAAASAADTRRPVTVLPSAAAVDEIGDLSRSFSSVLGQLGAYNEYLRTLASKLSHELRTPLAIVTSSLENLEQEALGEASKNYTSRARDGAERLRRDTRRDERSKPRRGADGERRDRAFRARRGGRFRRRRLPRRLPGTPLRAAGRRGRRLRRRGRTGTLDPAARQAHRQCREFFAGRRHDRHRRTTRRRRGAHRRQQSRPTLAGPYAGTIVRLDGFGAAARREHAPRPRAVCCPPDCRRPQWPHRSQGYRRWGTLLGVAACGCCSRPARTRRSPRLTSPD